MPTKPFTNTALYYKMMLESEPTPLATKWFGGFYDGSKANVGHYKMVAMKNHDSLLNGFTLVDFPGQGHSICRAQVNTTLGLPSDSKN